MLLYTGFYRRIFNYQCFEGIFIGPQIQNLATEFDISCSLQCENSHIKRQKKLFWDLKQHDINKYKSINDTKQLHTLTLIFTMPWPLASGFTKLMGKLETRNLNRFFLNFCLNLASQKKPGSTVVGVALKMLNSVQKTTGLYSMTLLNVIWLYDLCNSLFH